jgi:hypothetical protein
MTRWSFSFFIQKLAFILFKAFCNMSSENIQTLLIPLYITSWLNSSNQRDHDSNELWESLYVHLQNASDCFDQFLLCRYSFSAFSRIKPLYNKILILNNIKKRFLHLIRLVKRSDRTFYSSKKKFSHRSVNIFLKQKSSTYY